MDVEYFVCTCSSNAFVADLSVYTTSYIQSIWTVTLQVRLALPAVMPDVKRTVRLPEGVTALEKVNAATSALLTDTDRRVCNEARSMHATFKAVPVRLTGVGVLGIHGASAKPEYEPCKRVCQVETLRVPYHIISYERTRLVAS